MTPQALLNYVEGLVTNVGTEVGSTIGSVLQSLENSILQYVVAPVDNGVSNALNSVESGLSSLQNAATIGIENTVTAASQSIGTFISSAETGFTNVLGGVETGIQTLGDAIGTVFQNIVAGVESGFSALTSGVGEAITTVGTDLAQGLEAFATQIAAAFTPIFTGIVAFLEGLPADLEKIAGDISATLQDLGKALQPVLTDIDTDITRRLPEAAAANITEAKLNETTQVHVSVTNQIPQFIADLLGVQLSGDFAVGLGRISLLAAMEGGIGMIEEIYPGAAFILARILNHISDAVAIGDFRTLQYAGNAGTPNVLPGMGDLIKGRYRGTVADAFFYDSMLKMGYTQANADIIYSNALSLLGLNELVALYKRGVIPDMTALTILANQIQVDPATLSNAVELYNQLLGMGEMVQMWRRGVVVEGDTTPFADALKGGFTPERITALQEISYNLPNVEQLKEFIIRQVNDDSIAQKYGLDTGLTPDFIASAAKVGWDAPTAKQLYRTTWQFPPFFILKTMYAAGEISQMDFTTLLSMQGFPSYFISAFESTLAPKLSQGDIKDMYKYEVIDADQIVPMLVDIGVPQALAAQLSELWQASVKLASPLDQTQSQTAAAALKGETKGLIITAYKDGILTNADATTQLVALDDTTEAASLRLSIADYQLSQENIKQVYATDKDNYLAGNITIEQVLTDLSASGATSQQQAQYFNDLQYAGRSKPKMPSEAELVKWYQGSYIGEQQLADGLSLLGYADTWIPFFLLEAGVSSADVTALGYTIGTAS